jgi:hypothetical protein
MTSIEAIVISTVLIGIVAIVLGYWHYEHKTELAINEAHYQRERHIHVNFPSGSEHELEIYGRVQFKNHIQFLTETQVVFRTRGRTSSSDPQGYLSGETVTMSWRLFQDLLIEECEE